MSARPGPGMAMARLARLELTYPERGATAGDLPGGYSHVDVEGILGHGRGTYARAVEALMTWQLQQRAGLSVRVDTPRAVVGTDVLQRIGVGRLRIDAPCRVVSVVDEADRGGFAYGSLQGHPFCGEERFVVRIDEAGRVLLRVRAFSRPAVWWARSAGPVVRLAQRMAARLYIRALRRACTVNTN